MREEDGVPAVKGYHGLFKEERRWGAGMGEFLRRDVRGKEVEPALEKCEGTDSVALLELTRSEQGAGKQCGDLVGRITVQVLREPAHGA